MFSIKMYSESTIRTTEAKKLGYIDALRGSAAVVVALYHFSMVTLPKAVTPAWLAPLTGYGFSGVTLFFLVSAFTLCLSMSSRKEHESTPVFNYFIRRLARIAPLFYFWMEIGYFRDAIVFGVTHKPSEFYPSLFFVMNLCPGNECGFVWSSWSIGVEALFYLFFPFIFSAINSFRKAGIAILAALVGKVAWYFILINSFPDRALAEHYYNLSFLNHLPTFFVGVLCFLIYQRIDREAALRNRLGYLLIGAFMVGYFGFTYGGISGHDFTDATFQAILFSALLLGLSISPLPILVNQVTRFYGKISYSFYLTHLTAISMMSPIFARIYGSSSSLSIAYLISIALTLLVITSVSYLTYLSIERPGINLGRIMIQKSRFPVTCNLVFNRIVKELVVTSPLVASVLTACLMIAAVRYVP
jgi:peptidoglycan/LPS O-acetylase OafA/YrhL